jgi:signal transduction histidine kinase
MLVDAPFGVALLESRELRFLFANPVYESWYQSEGRRLAGQRLEHALKVARHVVPLFRAVAESGEAQLFRNAEFRGLPGRPVVLSGDVTLWDWGIYPIKDEAGTVTHLLVTGVDVTGPAIDRLELRSYTDQLAMLESSKSDFLRLASHELGNPIATVRGYLSMIEEGTIEGVSGEAREILPVLSAKMLQMERLVRQMMEAARLEDARLELHVWPIDLCDLVEEAVGSVGTAATGRHRLRTDLPAQPVVVRADRGRILMVITNLLDNAIKYSPGGGEVSCRVGSHGQAALVAVSDQGLGIAAEDQPALFSRFSRIDSDNARQIPGTGLGLYLCRQIARLHGGDIDVRSEPGRGSTFTLRLPA